MTQVRVLILGIRGLAFAGKDEVRLQLQAMLEGRPVRVIEARYAQRIYEMVGKLCLDAHPLMSKAAKEKPREELGGLSVREMLISCGEGARRYAEDVWVKVWERDVHSQLAEAIEEGHGVVVVVAPDLRKDVERRALYELAHVVAARFPNAITHASVLHVRSVQAQDNRFSEPGTETPLTVLEGEFALENDRTVHRGNLALQLLRALRKMPAAIMDQALPRDPSAHGVAERAIDLREMEEKRHA